MKVFEKVIWSGELSIDNTNIDYDHQKLLVIYNDLVDLIKSNGNNEEFARILSEMTDYVLKHFKKEEAYMQEFDYPKIIEHKQYHSDYNYKVGMYNLNLLRKNPTEPVEIIKFLKKWWTNHIKDNDKEFETYKKEIQSDAIYSSVNW